MGGRGANSGIPRSYPGGGGGGGGGDNAPMDMMPGSPKTLAEALGKKGRPMSTRDAIMKANPFYDRARTTREYNENCQRAVIATEARFRGYDVIAQPTYDGDTMPSSGNWAKNFVGANVEDAGRTTANAARKALEGKMRGYGNGARAIMAVYWKNAKSGHVLNVVQRGNNTYYYDGQDGSIVSPKALFDAIRTRETKVARVDNLDFSDTAKEAIRKTPRNRRK